MIRGLASIVFPFLMVGIWGEEKPLSETLTIFHAGSLAVPMKELTGAFKVKRPQVSFRLEAAGSVACARKVTELNQVPDILASADYTVIEQLLIPSHATWCIRFAGNEMALVHRKESRKVDVISAANWPEILLDNQVAFGRSDPDADPCGYRAVLTMQLAERHYRKPGFAERLLAKDRQHIRPKETDLLALLESGAIDYIFLYRSVAEQHRLPFVVLPDQVNLKRPELADLYRSVSVQVRGGKPGEKLTMFGEPMVYGLTVPTKAPRAELAVAFCAFVLGPEGSALLAKLGQPSLVPSPTPSFGQVPLALKAFALPVTKLPEPPAKP
jgi:molybdate/tungstate transport system substrate-binding protein